MRFVPESKAGWLSRGLEEVSEYRLKVINLCLMRKKKKKAVKANAFPMCGLRALTGHEELMLESRSCVSSH